MQAETLAQRHARAFTERRVEFERVADGMAWLHLHLEASDALLICDRLQRVAADAATSAVESRTPGQLRADVARDLLLEGVPPIGEAFHVAAATIQPTVHVTVPVLTLLDANAAADADCASGGVSRGRLGVRAVSRDVLDGVVDGALDRVRGGALAPAELDGYGPIASDVARRLAGHAPSFTRLLTHPVDGVVLDLDRTVYRPPADLIKWLRVRDQTCRFPGCNRRASRCELDHTDDFAHGGRTAFDNLAHLCAHHHHLKHESSWTVSHLRDGVLEWRSPTGRSHTTEPARPMETSAPVGSRNPPDRGQVTLENPPSHQTDRFPRLAPVLNARS